MNKAQLARTYGLEEEAIDAFCRGGLIPMESGTDPETAVFGPAAETAVKKILVLRGIRLSDEQIADALADPEFFSEAACEAVMNALSDTLPEGPEQARLMLYVRELRTRDPEKLNQDLAGLLPDMPGLPGVTEDMMLGLMGLTQGVRPPWFPEEYMDELQTVSDLWEGFLERMGDVMEQEVEPEDPEAQEAVDDLVRDGREVIGLVLHLGAVTSREIADAAARINGQEPEATGSWLDAYGLLAGWCREARSLARIQDRAAFEAWLDARLGVLRLLDEGGEAGDPDALRAHCEEAYESIRSSGVVISPELLDLLEQSFLVGGEIGFQLDGEDADEEDLEAFRYYVDFLFRAIRHYRDTHPSEGE